MSMNREAATEQPTRRDMYVIVQPEQLVAPSWPPPLVLQHSASAKASRAEPLHSRAGLQPPSPLEGWGKSRRSGDFPFMPTSSNYTTTPEFLSSSPPSSPGSSLCPASSPLGADQGDEKAREREGRESDRHSRNRREKQGWGAEAAGNTFERHPAEVREESSKKDVTRAEGNRRKTEKEREDIERVERERKEWRLGVKDSEEKEWRERGERRLQSLPPHYPPSVLRGLAAGGARSVASSSASKSSRTEKETRAQLTQLFNEFAEPRRCRASGTRVPLIHLLRHTCGGCRTEKVLDKTGLLALFSRLPAMVFERFFDLLDEDGDQTVDVKEFCKGLDSLCSQNEEKLLRFLFNLCDLDGNGSIEREELRTLLYHLPFRLWKFSRRSKRRHVRDREARRERRDRREHRALSLPSPSVLGFAAASDARSPRHGAETDSQDKEKRHSSGAFGSEASRAESEARLSGHARRPSPSVRFASDGRSASPGGSWSEAREDFGGARRTRDEDSCGSSQERPEEELLLDARPHKHRGFASSASSSSSSGSSSSSDDDQEGEARDEEDSLRFDEQDHLVRKRIDEIVEACFLHKRKEQRRSVCSTAPSAGEAPVHGLRERIPPPLSLPIQREEGLTFEEFLAALASNREIHDLLNFFYLQSVLSLFAPRGPPLTLPPSFSSLPSQAASRHPAAPLQANDCAAASRSPSPGGDGRRASTAERACEREGLRGPAHAAASALPPVCPPSPPLLAAEAPASPQPLPELLPPSAVPLSLSSRSASPSSFPGPSSPSSPSSSHSGEPPPSAGARGARATALPGERRTAPQAASASRSSDGGADGSSAEKEAPGGAQGATRGGFLSHAWSHVSAASNKDRCERARSMSVELEGGAKGQAGGARRERRLFSLFSPSRGVLSAAARSKPKAKAGCEGAPTSENAAEAEGATEVAMEERGADSTPSGCGGEKQPPAANTKENTARSEEATACLSPPWISSRRPLPAPIPHFPLPPTFPSSSFLGFSGSAASGEGTTAARVGAASPPHASGISDRPGIASEDPAGMHNKAGGAGAALPSPPPRLGVDRPLELVVSSAVSAAGRRVAVLGEVCGVRFGGRRLYVARALFSFTGVVLASDAVLVAVLQPRRSAERRDRRRRPRAASQRLPHGVDRWLVLRRVRTVGRRSEAHPPPLAAASSALARRGRTPAHRGGRRRGGRHHDGNRRRRAARNGGGSGGSRVAATRGGKAPRQGTGGPTGDVSPAARRWRKAETVQRRGGGRRARAQWKLGSPTQRERGRRSRGRGEEDAEVAILYQPARRRTVSAYARSLSRGTNLVGSVISGGARSFLTRVGFGRGAGDGEPFFLSFLGNEDRLQMHGWLWKVGQHFGGWIRRYYFLTGRHLWWQSQILSTRPANCLYLHGCSVHALVDDPYRTSEPQAARATSPSFTSPVTGTRGRFGLEILKPSGRVAKRLYAIDADDRQNWLRALQVACGVEDFHDFYCLHAEEVLGHGKFAAVKLGHAKATGQMVAVKILNRSNLRTEEDREFTRRELEVVKVLQHPNLVRTVDVFGRSGTAPYAYIVMELLPHRDLATLIRLTRVIQYLSLKLLLRQRRQFLQARGCVPASASIHISALPRPNPLLFPPLSAAPSPFRNPDTLALPPRNLAVLMPSAPSSPSSPSSPSAASAASPARAAVASPLCAERFLETDFTMDSRCLLEEQVILKIVTGLLKATRHMHAKGVVHRDLKPENLLLVLAPPQDEASAGGEAGRPASPRGRGPEQGDAGAGLRGCGDGSQGGEGAGKGGEESASEDDARSQPRDAGAREAASPLPTIVIRDTENGVWHYHPFPPQSPAGMLMGTSGLPPPASGSPRPSPCAGRLEGDNPQGATQSGGEAAAPGDNAGRGAAMQQGALAAVSRPASPSSASPPQSSASASSSPSAPASPASPGFAALPAAALPAAGIPTSSALFSSPCAGGGWHACDPLIEDLKGFPRTILAAEELAEIEDWVPALVSRSPSRKFLLQPSRPLYGRSPPLSRYYRSRRTRRRNFFRFSSAAPRPHAGRTRLLSLFTFGRRRGPLSGREGPAREFEETDGERRDRREREAEDSERRRIGRQRGQTDLIWRLLADAAVPEEGTDEDDEDDEAAQSTDAATGDTADVQREAKAAAEGRGDERAQGGRDAAPAPPSAAAAASAGAEEERGWGAAAVQQSQGAEARGASLRETRRRIASVLASSTTTNYLAVPGPRVLPFFEQLPAASEPQAPAASSALRRPPQLSPAGLTAGRRDTRRLRSVPSSLRAPCPPCAPASGDGDGLPAAEDAPREASEGAKRRASALPVLAARGESLGGTKAPRGSTGGDGGVFSPTAPAPKEPEGPSSGPTGSPPSPASSPSTPSPSSLATSLPSSHSSSSSAAARRVGLESLARPSPCAGNEAERLQWCVGVLREIQERLLSIKVADFGLSAVLAPNWRTTDSLGTLAYAAPEVLVGVEYDKAVDMWSIGVITFELLSQGVLPFQGKTEAQIGASILEGRYSFDIRPNDRPWLFAPRPVPPAARDFVSRLLCHPARRMNIEEALRHPWIADGHQVHVAPPTPKKFYVA
ncbi:hypothetical protein BESB_016030 [Besnoitia besnoiti]|uniref:Protein kinase domain-containing protein n=1 Tax=Besnoitia besnoiti TaxID=94643 RepID=A0A2A9M2U2_BESBE|nr:hypothetical protein BESB_016030 [Besnoitia besnoiti]PFH32285.1 hypothetical protein BESB_016030 [Besnoitia besnoiti]